MTLLQRQRFEASKAWPAEADRFKSCTFVRPKMEVRGSLGIHSYATELLLAQPCKELGSFKPDWKIWSARTEAWFYLAHWEVAECDSEGLPIEM